MSLRSSARPSPRNQQPSTNGDPSSSSDFSSPDGAAVVNSPAASSAAAAAQRQRRALVRLVGGWWPLPLRSSSTLACLFGFCLLSLVLVDEVATHLRHTHTTPAIRPAGAGPALLHVLRHSFLYRCLLCLAWIAAVFAHGLFVHRGRREKRRRGSSSAASSPMSSSAESSPLLSPATYAGVVKKSVTFVLGTVDRSTSSLGSSISSGGSANDALRALAPNARPSTKKRLILFFILALLLALCGIAFELYLALVAHGSPHAHATAAASSSTSSLVGGSTLPASVVDGVESVLNAFSWSWLLSLLSRALMLLIWLVLFAGACWVAWWRKAIGTRKSGGAAALKRKPLSSIAETEEEEEEDEEEWTDDEEEEAEDAEAIVEQHQQQPDKSDDAASSATAATTTQPLVPFPPVAPSATMMSPPLLSAATDDDDASAGEQSDDSEWEEEADEAAAAASGGGVASFAVPSAAELLLAEKLDASLFFHPEQAQNQYEVGVGGTLRKQQRPQTLTIDQQRPPLSGGMRRGTSATNSPLHSNLRAAPAHMMARRGSTSSTHPIASFNNSKNSNMRESPVMAPAVPADAACSLPQTSPPPFTLPLSGGLLNQSTLYHLASTKFIAPLSQADFQNVLPEMQWMQVAAGEDVYARGQRMQQQQPRSARRRSSSLSTPESDSTSSESPSDGMFIIVSGTIGALNPSNPDQILSTYHQGDSLGELEFLFADLPRALTMRALTPVQLLHIPTRLGRLWRASQIAEGEEMEQEAGQEERKSSNISGGSIDDDLDPSASVTTSLQSTLPFVSAHSGSDELRSDILLAFVRTTLARQWRSAQYVLDQYLHVPLTSEFLIAGSTHAMAIQQQHQQQQEDITALSSPAAAPSRYFSPAFSSFFPSSSQLLQSLRMRAANQVELSPGQSLFEEDSYRSDQLFVVLSGTVVLSSAREMTTPTSRSMELGPGSVLNAVAYLTDSVHSHSCKAGSALTRVGWLSRSELSVPNAEVLRLALLVCEVLAPTLAQYQSLGFERKWIRAGTLVFAESEMCDAVYCIASGRVRVVTGKMKKLAGSKRSKKTAASAAAEPGASSPPQKKRSAASSASSSTHPHPSGLDLSVFTEAHRYSQTQHTAGARIIAKSSAAAASGRVKFELGRGELVGELTFFGDVTRDDESAGSIDAAHHSTLRHTATALCVKDAELVKISRGCFENLIRSHPRTLIKLLAIVTKRMRDVMGSGSANSAGAAATAAATSQQNASVLSSVPRSPFLRTPTSSGTSSCMSVCLLTSSPAVALSDFALSLSVSLSAHGRTMLLTPAHVDRMLGEGTCSQLNSYVTRAAFAYWLAHVESSYSFCLFVSDPAVTPWTRQCIRSGDLTLIVANAHLSEGAEEEEEDEDELEEAELLQRAKRRRHTHRAQRVSKFERMCVWDDYSIAERRMPAQPPAVPAELERLPLGRASSRSPQVEAINTMAFSPTLHPSPPPPLSASASSSASSLASSITGHYSRCAPRMHFSLRDLVLLHPSSTTMPRGTRWWYACRPNLHRFHHVAVGCAEHTDRLARYIAGKTVGVVLSGGGARGLSHLGVLTSFAEQGVPVDFIGGTSQGSFMSALYASQPFHHPAALAQFALRTHMLAESMGSIRSLLSDATFPMLSYFAGQKFGSHIARILGEHTRIEDLWIPFFLVTTNLSQADMCVHETGRLWKAVRASMTVLDYLPPMQMSRSWPDLLIDGGYTNNLPVDVMHGLFQPRYVIGVDVENKASEEKIQRVSYFGAHLSGWWLLRKRLTEWLKEGWIVRTAKRVGVMLKIRGADLPPPFFHLPKFAELVGSLIYINHNRNIRQSLAGKLLDLYIRPELGSAALLDYHREAEIIDIGYACTKVKLTEWRLKNSAHLPKATPAPAMSSGVQSVNTSAAGSNNGAAGLAPVSLQAAAALAPSTLNASGAASASPLPIIAASPSASVASSLSRRKSSGASLTRSAVAGFMPPASLTFTQSLTASPMHRPTASSGSRSLNGSPAMHAQASPGASVASDGQQHARKHSLGPLPSSSEFSLVHAQEHEQARSAAISLHAFDSHNHHDAAASDSATATATRATRGLSIIDSINPQQQQQQSVESNDASNPSSHAPSPAAATAAVLYPSYDDSVARTLAHTPGAGTLRRNFSESDLREE